MPHQMSVEDCLTHLLTLANGRRSKWNAWDWTKWSLHWSVQAVFKGGFSSQQCAPFQIHAREEMGQGSFLTARAGSYILCPHFTPIQWHLKFKSINKHLGNLLQQSVPHIALQSLSSLTHCLSPVPCYTESSIPSLQPCLPWRLTQFPVSMSFDLYLTRTLSPFSFSELICGHILK